MTEAYEADPRASTREALERSWPLGQRLAVARRDLAGTLPMVPAAESQDRAAAGTGAAEPMSLAMSDLDQVLIDSFLFRLSAVLSALTEEVMEGVLLAKDEVFVLYLVFIYDVDDTLRDLERCGAIASADEILAVRERVRRHYQIATLRGEEQADALNRAWADDRVVLDMLAWLFRHLQEKDLLPGFVPFEEGLA